MRLLKRRRFDGWRAGKSRLIVVETSALSDRVEAIDLFTGEERRERGGGGGTKRENKGKKVLLWRREEVRSSSQFCSILSVLFERSVARMKDEVGR